MARWFCKRWVCAALTGATLAAGFAAAQPNGSPPKVGTVIPLNIDGKGERQFKVIKSERQPDGSFLSELKDTKSGDTITLYDKPTGDTPPAPVKGGDTPRPKAQAGDKSSPADPPKERERRPILNRIFGDRDKDKDAMPATGPAMDADRDSEKKPGILSRIFGPKKPSAPSMPAPTANVPGLNTGSSAPPPIIPTPQGGVRNPAPGVPSTAEPPRAPGTRPTPAPANPAPLPIPTQMPATRPAPPPSASAPSVPSVPALPTSTPAPLPIPSIPSPPGASSLPSIPTPMGGTSMYYGPAHRAPQAVVPASYRTAQAAFARDVQPFAIALQTMEAPSARLTAAKGLADCRHSSSEGVKAVLFQAARLDPCAEVRAACITHLCDLGFFDAQFLGYIQTACQDADPMVRAAAQKACAKMMRK